MAKTVFKSISSCEHGDHAHCAMEPFDSVLLFLTHWWKNKINSAYYSVISMISLRRSKTARDIGLLVLLLLLSVDADAAAPVNVC